MPVVWGWRRGGATGTAVALLSVLLTCPGSAAAQRPANEPEAVVQELDRLITRQPDMVSPQGLRREIARWKVVNANYPRSRAAAEHLAGLQDTLAEQTGALADRKARTETWLRAGAIALDHGEVRYTDRITHALVDIGDEARLHEFFTRCFEVAGRGDPTALYLPFMDYADGLTAFGRPDARVYYQRAFELHVNEAALNTYVRYLLEQRDPAAALAVIESISEDERRMNDVVLSLWRRALREVGRDTAPADTALAELERRFRGAQGGVFVAPR